MGVKRLSVHLNIVIFQKGESEVEDENGHNVSYLKTSEKHRSEESSELKKADMRVKASDYIP